MSKLVRAKYQRKFHACQHADWEIMYGTLLKLLKTAILLMVTFPTFLCSRITAQKFL